MHLNHVKLNDQLNISLKEFLKIQFGRALICINIECVLYIVLTFYKEERERPAQTSKRTSARSVCFFSRLVGARAQFDSEPGSMVITLRSLLRKDALLRDMQL